MKRQMDRWREKERGGDENGTKKQQRKERGRIERDCGRLITDTHTHTHTYIYIEREDNEKELDMKR